MRGCERLEVYDKVMNCGLRLQVAVVGCGLRLRLRLRLLFVLPRVGDNII